MYGLLEKQFRGYYYKAARMKGITGENLLSLLERRLDNVAVRCGFASSHAEARQLVRHGHFTVNGSKINIPSYLVHAGDEIVVREKSRRIQKINEALAKLDRSPLPQWIEIDRDAFKGKIKNVPARADISADIDEQLIVELYSK
jgi:small subunit ribosomal protein S4